ncbi:MAG TPA: DHH family phosphoesterase, partial [Thermoanaerobaculia bacterium]|nr:DHH family phosphoesterase [Thermoanaerobaculia bacterium]
MPEAAGELERGGFPAWLAMLLARRGVADGPGAERFLRPSLDQLHDPYLLCGMEEGVDLLLKARERGDCVAVVGDYDVDGVTATALLLAVFGACGLTVRPILPHRLREGYGFQPVHVERAREQGCRVIVTADCGSSSAEAVAAALGSGIDVLVTDHHLPGCDLPAGAVQINPRQPVCSYPYPYLAAAGLAFKLATALAARCGRPLEVAALLRIACLGTIADLVPLTGENRVIAALGLEALGTARSQGLKALIR